MAIELTTASRSELDAIRQAIFAAPGNYEIKSSDFTAAPQKGYAVNTTSGVVSCSLPASPSQGDLICFVDAKNSWSTNAIQILRNGHKIEGADVNFVNSAAGTFFGMAYIDSTTGWKVLISGTRPINISAPVISGSYTLTTTNGVWTGNPTTFTYQWQRSLDGGDSWSNISGATSASYIPTEEEDETNYLRVLIVANNANGPSNTVASESVGPIDIPDFPLGNLIAFWKLSDTSDSSGNSKTLTNNNSVSFVSGLIGNCASGDGADYFSINLPLGFDTGVYSFSFWVRPYELFNTLSVMAGFHPGFAIGYSSSNNGYVINSFAGEDTIYNTGINMNGWTHIGAVIDNGNDGKLYLNGNPVWSGSVVVDNVNALQIFTQYNHHNLRAKIDSFGIWGRELSALEYARLYNNGAGNESI